MAVLYAAALAAWFTLRSKMGQIGFYVLFALVVTQSVQLVGIYLVFASLIIPALAAKRFAAPLRLGVGYGVGLAAYVLVALLAVFVVVAVAANFAPKFARAAVSAWKRSGGPQRRRRQLAVIWGEQVREELESRLRPSRVHASLAFAAETGLSTLELEPAGAGP